MFCRFVSGLGVLLVVVVGVGWKCTPRGHEPLHALFNLGEFRRRSRRHRERRRRDGRWYGGRMKALNSANVTNQMKIGPNYCPVFLITKLMQSSGLKLKILF